MDKPTIGQILDGLPPRADLTTDWDVLRRGRVVLTDHSSPVVAGAGRVPYYRQQVQQLAGMMGLPVRLQTPSVRGYPSFHERLAVTRDRLDEFLAYTLADITTAPYTDVVRYMQRAPFSPAVDALQYVRVMQRTEDFLAMGGRKVKPLLVPARPRIAPQWPRAQFASQYVRQEWKRYIRGSAVWSSRPYALYDYMDSLTPMHEVKPVEAMRLKRKIRGAQDIGRRGQRENPIVGWPYWLEDDVDKDIDRWANRH